ncbi:CheR family methyltransferase [Geoalkalibacter halelectricus]|uniref:histidine kinase n=1 Tax=Geoalkalibacter halelectricus TaxID=2847045 RepID=A0ABY5ZNS4_9BACT|nr:CheR family methyltransferase [Geoalkalibacter halelectricus]MDO3380100.1 ATP-binding protein [Geoalkalibacter halelectricus]UWZ80381.1 ATP-binding protein [Geoalkalibacter halelectricus]
MTTGRSENLPSPPIVAVGVSPRHLDPLKTFLANLPAHTGMAVVILCPPPEGGSRGLAAALGRCTALKVRTARPGQALKPDAVYLLPAASLLRVENGRLHLDPLPDDSMPPAPIGHFLRSLAEQQGDQAAAVILAGTSGDGTLGLRALKAQGGLVLAQAGVDQSHRELADWVLQPADLAGKLAQIAPFLGASSQGDKPTTSDGRNLRAILELLHQRHGHDFACYKNKTLLRRIRRRLVIRGKRTLSDYLKLLRTSEEEIDALFHDLLIGVTRFFRDEQALALVRKTVVPALISAHADEGPLRAWVAGCSTGEEAYSLAILFCEALKQADSNLDIQIFATDLDPEAIAVARAGFYPSGIARDISAARLEAYFERVEDGYRVKEDLREKILFAHHNLLKDPPFSQLDLISCRNLLIYLEPSVQKKLLVSFHQVLRPGGHLLLGASEHLGEAAQYFRVVDKKWRLYQRGPGQPPRAQRLTLPPFGTTIGPPPHPPTARASQVSLGAVAEKKLLRDYAPAAVVVNRDLDVVHFPSDAGDFLVPPIGAAQFNLIRMAREELQPVLRSITFKAFKEKRKTVYQDVRLHLGGRTRLLNVIADPFGAGFSDDLLLVVIQETTESPLAPEAASAEADPALPVAHDKEHLIQYLEEELKNKTEQLASAVREYETSHEELMSINEELHSANEELETSREELQALNEELITVNAEVQNKNEELARTSSDLSNLIKSAQIATIFLDKDGRVRRFTPAAAEIFNLIDSDLGRPFHHIAGKLDTDPILAGARTVLKKLNEHEQEMCTADGRCYLLRIFPYRSLQDVIEGVVISFIDITLRKQAEEEREQQRQVAEERAREAEEARSVLQAILDHIPLGLGVADQDGNLHMLSRNGLDMCGLSLDQVRASTMREYSQLWGMHHLDGVQPARPEELPLVRAIRKGEVTSGSEWLLQCGLGEPLVVAVHAAPIRDKGGDISGAVVAWSDITEARKQKLALEESERRLKVVVDNLPAMVFAADERGQIVFWNRECERVTGFLAEEVVGNPMAPERLFADADNRRRWLQDICSAEGGTGSVELAIKCKNGARKTILWSNGACTCIIPGWNIWGSGIDISERKETEKALNEARQAAENASRAKSDFLANVSHEVRTPLTIIKSAQELLAETPLTPYQEQFLDMAQSSAETLLRLIEDLLDFSRIEARRMVLEELPFDLVDTLETTLAGFAMEAAKKKLPIHFKVEPSVPRHIIGDSLRLRQVVTNLLSNAVKFTQTGRIDLSICLKKDEKIAPGSAMLLFSVRDSGIGIPAEKQSLLFQSFSQIDGSATRRYGGTGLGLAICQRIVCQMGGEIWVESEEGRGSEFFFSIPARPFLEPELVPVPKTRRAPPTETYAKPLNRTARILVAEDEAMIRHLVATVLKRKGWEVVTATDGAEAMERLENDSFDLVLMDIQMPQLDGMQVTRILRQKEVEIGRRTPVIALTAHAGEDDRRRFLRAGMDGRITKPIQIGEFLQTIEKTLGDTPNAS